MASQAVTTLVTEAGTKGWSAFWAISSFPSASITSTSPDGASAATFSLAPARAGAGSKSRAQASRRDHMALQRGIGDAGTIARAKGRRQKGSPPDQDSGSRRKRNSRSGRKRYRE